MNVFLADDETMVRGALRVLFEQQNDLHVVGEASSGQALLAALVTTNPDVVLLDWELPGPSAPALVRGIRLLSPLTRVVALSGRIEAYRAALDAGVDAFVSKGDPPDRLLGTLYVLGHTPRGADSLSTLHLSES
jgi:DNA-binding NarL/FixJ family response regulator